ncbi:MAG: HipA domain-containing protein [Clostridiales bacterium]|nr:HipA domain-containing protein [Clostridiales bacterium]
MVDFNEIKIVAVYYGGNAGAKEAVLYDDAVWMLKYPKTTRDMKNPQMSYTTSPLSEFIGSKVYETLGIPVHETLLGVRQGKVVVACKDFLRYDMTNLMVQNFFLIHFHNLKNSFMASDLDNFSGTGSETFLDEVLATVKGEATLSSIPGVLERFWDMFVVDAFIGNNDRNNENWGLLLEPFSGKKLAPIYDNGNAFFNKRSLAQMEKRLADSVAMEEDAYKTQLCVYKYKGIDNEGIKINPFDYIKNTNDPDCKAALLRFLNAVNLKAIKELIQKIPETHGNLAVMPAIQKQFYIRLLELRLGYLSACV